MDENYTYTTKERLKELEEKERKFHIVTGYLTGTLKGADGSRLELAKRLLKIMEEDVL